MNDAINAMLKTYGPIKGQYSEDSALKEIIQQITLSGLQRGGFFNEACFYGGTALRILYGLDRFSEDLDFCLIKKNLSFNFDPYAVQVISELARFGFTVSFETKKSGENNTIESAFVKQDTYSALLLIGKDSSRAQKGQLIKVKLEVDKESPGGFDYESKLIKLPIPFMVNTLTPESLFAGKIHALIARAYLNRVKGRDFYDFLFYASRDVNVNLRYLESKLKDSGHLDKSRKLDGKMLIKLLKEKFDKIDFENAKKDVKPFLKPDNVSSVDRWNAEIFKAVAETVKGVW